MSRKRATEAGQRASTGRRRNDESHRAILRAAMGLLEEIGYRAITIEKIAAKAGVGKQTIYRWWPSRAAVVLEASVQAAADTAPYPDTGSLSTDLRAFLTASIVPLEGPTGPVLRGLVAETQLDEEFRQQFVESFIRPRRAGLIEILRRGAERGELSADVNPELLADMIYGAKWNRLLFGHAPLDARMASQMVKLVRCLD
jgi:AcrR family transcriptional regulator